jgi:hypothetical protein
MTTNMWKSFWTTYREIKMEDKKPKCRLTEAEENVFAIIGTVNRALSKAGLTREALEFRQKAFDGRKYEDILALCFEYVDVV